MREQAPDPCGEAERLLEPYSTLCPGSLELIECEPLDNDLTLVLAEACGAKVYAVVTREASIDRLVREHCGRGWRLARRTRRSTIYARDEALLRVFTVSEEGVDEDRFLEYLERAAPGIAPRLLCRLRHRGALLIVSARRVKGTPLAELAASYIAGGGPESAPRLLRLMGRTLALLHRAMMECKQDWCESQQAIAADARRWVERLSHRAQILERAWRGDEWARLGRSALEQLKRELEPPWEGLTLLRGHGDPHLYQALVMGQRVILTDFEGEPLRLPARRWEREPPERDLAVALRSLDYAAWLHTSRPGRAQGARVALLARALLEGYKASALTSLDLGVLAFWLVERASYEIVYELLEETGLEHVPALALASIRAHGPEEYLEALLSGSLYSIAPYTRPRLPDYDS